MGPHQSATVGSEQDSLNIFCVNHLIAAAPADLEADRSNKSHFFG
jgi:hypothetical protein